MLTNFNCIYLFLLQVVENMMILQKQAISSSYFVCITGCSKSYMNISINLPVTQMRDDKFFLMARYNIHQSMYYCRIKHPLIYYNHERLSFSIFESTAFNQTWYTLYLFNVVCFRQHHLPFFYIMGCCVCVFYVLFTTTS